MKYDGQLGLLCCLTPTLDDDGGANTDLVTGMSAVLGVIARVAFHQVDELAFRINIWMNNCEICWMYEWVNKWFI